MKNKFKKILIVSSVVCFSFFTILVLWCSWENWSGARAWKKTKEMLRAEGIELDYRKLHSPMPPENQNFARTPLLAAISDFEKPKAESRGDSLVAKLKYENPELSEKVKAMKLPIIKDKKLYPLWRSGSPAKHQSLQKHLATEANGNIEILDWMKQFEAQFDELDEAATRAHSQIKYDIGETFIEQVSVSMPFLSEFKKLQKIQSIRACAALQVGDYEQARSALLISIQLHRAFVSHPTLIACAVGNAHLNSALSIIWQGLEAGQWREEDLVWIQQQLDGLEVLPNLEKALTSEMIYFQIGYANFLNDLSFSDLRELVKLMEPVGGDSSSSQIGLLALIVPSGVWDHNKAVGVRVMVEELILPIRERRIPSEEALAKRLKPLSYRNFLSKLILSGATRVSMRSFETAVAVDLAQVACEVERFQLKNGRYPDRLSEVMIDIPKDPMAPGKPLSYRKGAQGDRYRIYSVGINGTNEGGRVVFKSKNRPIRKLDEGDWAWGYRY